jgi:hypothetical protein
VVGALADHVPDLLNATWRSGLPSKALVVGIILSQALVVALAGADLLRGRTDNRGR